LERRGTSQRLGFKSVDRGLLQVRSLKAYTT
jgi:hypothetical protein